MICGNYHGYSGNYPTKINIPQTVATEEKGYKYDDTMLVAFFHNENINDDLFVLVNVMQSVLVLILQLVCCLQMCMLVQYPCTRINAMIVLGNLEGLFLVLVALEFVMVTFQWLFMHRRVKKRVKHNFEISVFFQTFDNCWLPVRYV